jgi:hypothetical protein
MTSSRVISRRAGSFPAGSAKADLRAQLPSKAQAFVGLSDAADLSAELSECTVNVGLNTGWNIGLNEEVERITSAYSTLLTTQLTNSAGSCSGGPWAPEQPATFAGVAQ